MLPSVSRRAHVLVFSVLAGLLVVLHLDVWNHRVGGLVFGWLPWDLAYHLAWMAAAAGLVWYMTVGPWTEDD